MTEKERILLIGANGTLGSYLHKRFSENYLVIPSSRSDTENPIDIESENSIIALFQKLGPIDHVISVAGEARWDHLAKLSQEDFYVGIRSKMMGQINLVRNASKVLKRGGSINLTSGILAFKPVQGSSIASMINGGLHSFVNAAASEMENEIRLNVVCPGLVEDSAEKYAEFFPGHQPISMEALFEAYQEVISSGKSGELIKIF